MAAVVGLGVASIIANWLEGSGINPKGVSRVEITVAANEIVEVRLHRFMQKDEVGEFQELLEKLSDNHVLVAEKYRLVEGAESAPADDHSYEHSSAGLGQ